MPEPSVRKPALVLAEPASDGGAPKPRLRARKCECGHVFFPPQSFGCERCGRPASALSDAPLEAAGVLTAIAVVRAHPKRAVPYAVGRIALDAGPVIEAVLAGTDDVVLGARVRGSLVPATDASGVEALDCMFAPVADEENAS
ncbi:MAG: zinc ribbon domain-containing protein [Polyangiales bacterium]